VIGWGIVDRGRLKDGLSPGNGLVVKGVKGVWMCLNDGVSEFQTLTIIPTHRPALFSID